VNGIVPSQKRSTEMADKDNSSYTGEGYKPSPFGIIEWLSGD
jgi:hypothetical protein